MKRYLRSLFATIAVLVVCATCLLAFVGRASNTTISVREMARRQMNDPLALALPFDLKFWADYKLEMVALRRPDVVLVGPSRSAQVRSGMFEPYNFYNMSLTAWDIDQTIEMLEQVFRVHRPRIVLMAMDYFMFSEPYVSSVRGNRDMWFNAGLRYWTGVTLQLLKEVWANPHFFVRTVSDRLTGRNLVDLDRAFGFSDLRGAGFRQDGSFQYGQGTLNQSVEKLKANEGILQAIPGAPKLSDTQLKRLSDLAKLARQNDATLIAIQFPIWKDTVQVLDSDPAYRGSSGVWHAFLDNGMAERFKALGIFFFDLSHNSFMGEYRNFIDAAHPSERGMLLSILSLSKTAGFAAILPEMNSQKLEDSLASADARHEAFSIYGFDK